MAAPAAAGAPPLRSFLSALPEVRLVSAPERPYEQVVAAARTCYSSKGIILAEEVSGDGIPDAEKRAKRAEQRDRIARSIYQAGHHTTFQHGHMTFALANVSRQFLWSFLHAHPFYNSEQVSQRYVEVKAGTWAVPPLAGEALDVYGRAMERSAAAYRRLIELLTPPAASEYFRRFPARGRRPEAWAREIQKKAQEIARYVLPVATFAYLYHTVSGLTLLRYWRICNQYDTPLETRIVVGKMVEALLSRDPLYHTVLEDPLPLEEMPEFRFYRERGGMPSAADARAIREEFDRSLGGRVSRLVDWKAKNEETLADAAREVLGLPRARLGDGEAIALVLDPAQNPLLGESLNLGTLSKLMRAAQHVHYTFRKKLSHTADSQDQRHRMTPGSRPVLAAQVTGEPDYIVPALVSRDAGAERAYRDAMEEAFEAYGRLRRLGVDPEFALYVLPNALAIRFTESADLLSLHHKLCTRLCYNAQEEIWRACADELAQIASVNPRIASHVGPPCALRNRARRSPICPEGDRYCGIPVWKLPLDQYQRVI